MVDPDVSRFFDSLSDDYTLTIQRCFPRYREMLETLLDYLPRNREFNSILELGCGTGNLSVLLASAYPEAQLRCVDLSDESLDVCRKRVGDRPNRDFEARDFRDLDYHAGQFDLVVASISIHHLVAEEKKKLFGNVAAWLERGGVFTYADQFRGARDDVYSRHVSNWKQSSLAAGSSEDEFEMWMEHQREHDHHDTLKEHFDWLGDSGFEHVDCVWRCWLWSVIQSYKP